MSAVQDVVARVARAEAAFEAAQRVAVSMDARADAYTVPEMAANAYSAAAAAHETLRRAEAELARWCRELEWQQHAEETRATVTPERLKAARLVRTRGGWEQVVRVNAKSVTTKGPWPFDDRRVPLADIVEVRP